MGYDPQVYQAEKANGLRLPSGAQPLTRLKGKHYRVINLHLAGVKGRDIAAQMGMTESWVSTVLNNPLVRDEMQKRFVDTDREMFAKATTTIAEKMDSDDPAISLRAAEMVWRSRGKFEKKLDDRPTAEDIVAKMLALAGEHGEASLRVTAGASGAPASPPTIDPLLLLDGESK